MIITLQEDQEQGEMDIAFFLSLTLYTIYLCYIDVLYPDPVAFKQVGDFHLVMSNIFAFFPIMQAQGLWLKGLLMMTAYLSICWHWSNIGKELPHGYDFYGKWDTIFSVCIIVAYALSWLPKCKSYEPTKAERKKSFWSRSCIGKPRETSEWRCRWTPHLIGNIFVCTIIAIIMYVDENHWIGFAVSWMAILFAIFLSLYQLCREKMTISKRYRKRFSGWAIIGISFGIIAYAYKNKSDEQDKYSNFNHSVWHVYVMSCAYSFSRASEYLEIYR